MIRKNKLVVVMPAYNAGRTLERTYGEIPHDVVDEVILTDDASSDDTVKIAEHLGIRVVRHERNLGYGGNLKTCFREALVAGADICVSLHPDYQYSPKLITAMAEMIASGEYDFVIGSRILGGGALAGGMPVYKYVSNRFLTAFQNLLFHKNFSEYHTGYRAWSRRILETLPLSRNSDNFIFDNQMFAQALYCEFRGGEVACPCRYIPECSSISACRSLDYGFGVLRVGLEYRLCKMGLINRRLFDSCSAAR